jgi:2'-5' RNA ligase
MKVRAFLAVEVSQPIRTALIELKRELQASGAAVRWVRDDGLHATVKFLGSVPETLVPDIEAVLRIAVGGCQPLTAAVRSLGAFPSTTRPRVVWVGLDCPALADVASAVDQALLPLGFAAETRPFRAHITLGRVSGPAGRVHLRDALDARRDDAFGSCAIAELIAYRSDLRRGGAVYTKLWTVPFGG